MGRILAPGAFGLAWVQNATASPSLPAMSPPNVGGRNVQKTVALSTVAVSAVVLVSRAASQRESMATAWVDATAVRAIKSADTLTIFAAQEGKVEWIMSLG